MKNITLSIEEDVLIAVRRYTAERNSSVNALIREYLGSVARHENRARQARQRLLELSQQSQGQLGGKTWDREDLHER